jgi:DNA-binding CsgD family transcriptional regulator
VSGPVGGVRFTSFLQYLNTFPKPESVARSVAHGPLARYGITSLNLWVQQDFVDLVCIGTSGMYEGDDNLYQRVSLSFDAPITDAFLSSATVLLSLSDVMNLYPSLNVDREFWERMLIANGEGDVGQVPILADGSPLGVYAFLSNTVNKWNNEDYAVLDAVAAALALWITHPRSGVMELVQSANGSGLNLSPRQSEILQLVRAGKSNVAISARLGYSQSTVKQELQRITKRLRVRSRTEAVSRAIELNLLPDVVDVPLESDRAGIS